MPNTKAKLSFPYCEHGWRGHGAELLQLYNENTNDVLAERIVSATERVGIGDAYSPIMLVNWTGSYTCRFPANLSVSSKPPFEVTILGKLQLILFQEQKCFDKCTCFPKRFMLLQTEGDKKQRLFFRKGQNW